MMYLFTYLYLREMVFFFRSLIFEELIDAFCKEAV